jgi:flagellar basal-body rod protein FlgG
MSGEIYMAAAAAVAYEKRLEIVANNLANVNTAGFKRDEVSFQAYLRSDTGAAVAVSPPYPGPGQAGPFWVDYRSRTDFSPGPLKPTGGAMDLAVNGKGFFSIQAPEGVVYTRRGNFSLNAEGVLVTQEGWPVMGENGEIRVGGAGAGRSAPEFSVAEDGSMSANRAALGRLRIVDVAEPETLVKTGDGYFRPATGDVDEQPLENVRVAQGFLEMANVETIKMMVEMMEILRGYESYQRTMRSVDETNAKSISELGRTG